MKKRIIRFLECAMLAVILLASCNSEETLLGGEETQVQGEKGKLSFVIPMGKKSPVTYAPGDAVTGEDDEYELKTMYIYWFVDGGSGYEMLSRFEYGFSNDDITLAPSSLSASTTQTVATIDVGDEVRPSHFYILANIDGSSVTAKQLESVAKGDPASKLEGIIADELDNKGLEIFSGGPKGLTPIACPLPMSISKGKTQATGGGNGYIEVTLPATHVVNDVVLKRRVARFDVLNTKDSTHFEVTRIIVNRAQKSGWLHDTDFDLTAPPMSGWPTGTAVFDGSKANGPAGSTEVHALNKRIFYLWPTVLKANSNPDGTPLAVQPADGTEILIEGKFYDKLTRLYRLNLKNDVNIEANKVYRIRIIQLTQDLLDIDLLKVDNWEEADTLETSNAGTDVNYVSCTIAASGTASASSATVDFTQSDNTLEYTSTKTDSVKITIVTEGTNLTNATAVKDRHTTAVNFIPVGVAGTDYLQTDFTDTKSATYVKSVTETQTYGVKYHTTHTITLPPTDAPLEFKLEIENPAVKGDMRVINMKSVCFNKTGKATVGLILDGSLSLISSGSGRWKKAVVKAVDAIGMPSEVAAWFGKINGTQYTAMFTSDNLNTVQLLYNALPDEIKVYPLPSGTTLSNPVSGAWYNSLKTFCATGYLMLLQSSKGTPRYWRLGSGDVGNNPSWAVTEFIDVIFYIPY